MTDKQESITFAFPCTTIGITSVLGRVWRLKEGVAGFKYWGGHGLPCSYAYRIKVQANLEAGDCMVKQSILPMSTVRNTVNIYTDIIGFSTCYGIEWCAFCSVGVANF